jgi:hypothetical protein
MTSSRSREDINALRQLALEDLMAMDDAQILAEAKESGEDVEAMALAMKAMLRETVASELRSRLLEARQKIARPMKASAGIRTFPTLEAIKRKVREAFQSEPALGLAYREGKEQSESDWQSLYEDLIELGAIAPDEDSH